MSHTKRIFIVGQPGAGRGLLAKTLADKLRWEFIDADFGLEYKIGLEIDTILGKEKVNSFPNTLTKILTSLINKDNIVATMDTSFVDSEHNQQLLSSEFTIFIDVSLPIQLKRISRNPSPLVEENNIEDLLSTLHIKRDQLFEQVSDIIINSNDNELEKHVEIIIEFLQKNNKLEIKNDDILPLSNKNSILFHKILHTPIKLSPQQAMCVRLLAEGRLAKEIARELNISFRTVEAHIAKAMEISGCTNSKELISLYLS